MFVSQALNTCMCTHICMGTKTISIMDDAYGMLKSEKRPGESFSDVIRKSFSRRRDIMEFAGAWKGIGAKATGVKKAVSQLRRRSTRELQGQYDRD